MKLRVPILDRIWRVKSAFTLDKPLVADDVFEKLSPLFQTQGTEVSLEGNTLTYSKKNPAAQDRLATFTSGTLQVNQTDGSTRLSYELGSTALFLCFLAPLFFLAFGQFATLINAIEKPAIEAEKAQEERKRQEEAQKPIELHWIDTMLGVPEPEQPGEDGGDEKEREELEGNHSPEMGYALAGIFCAIYGVGRMLEPYLVKRTFRAALRSPEETESPQANTNMEAGTKLAPQGGGPEKP